MLCGYVEFGNDACELIMMMMMMMLMYGAVM